MSSPIVRKMLGESKAPQVIVKQRPVDYYVCPHCNEEIHEKSSYLNENGQTVHAACGKPFEYPPTDWTKVAPEWRDLLQGKAKL